MSETKDEATIAFNFFVECYGVKYDRAIKCMTEARANLPAFYDFPAKH